MNKINNLSREILQSLNEQNSKEIIVSSDDSLAQSLLAKEILSTIKNERNNSFFSFIIENKHDEYSETHLLNSLLLTFYSKSLKCSFNNIEEKYTLKRFIKKHRLFNHLSRQVLRSINVCAAHTTKTAPTIIDDTQFFKDYTELSSLDLINYLNKYLYKISGHRKILIVIENYDFKNDILTTLLTEISSKIKKKLYFIFINSINQNQNYGFFNDTENYSLTKYDELEILSFLKTLFPNITETNANIYSKWIYEKSNGKISSVLSNINENENLIKEERLEKNHIHNFSETIESLNSIQKNLIFISSLFPNGLRKKYVYQYYSEYNSLASTNLDEEINNLLKKNILCYNGKNGDSLKILNKSFYRPVDVINYNDELMEYLYTIKEYLNNCLEEENIPNYEYSYLLHCAIFLYKNNELKTNLDKIVRLIDLEYSFYSFSYITSIYSKLYEIIQLLPNASILKVLDAFQKSSEFEKGMTIIQKISTLGTLNDDFLLYKAKFLTQTYEYHKALNELNSVTIANNEFYYVKLNILQQLFQEEECKKILNIVLQNDVKDKWYYIILRNSAHLVDYRSAESNLKSCCDFFKGRKFELATCLNNLGIIYLYNNKISNAKNCFEEAIDIFNKIESNEIFEAYCNISILYLLQHDQEQTLKYLNLAKKKIPLALHMDHILLNVNELIINYIYSLNQKETCIKILEKISQENDIKDEWTKLLINYNLNCFKSENEYNESFLKQIKARRNGFEVFFSKDTDGNIKFMLGLSPHWRY